MDFALDDMLVSRLLKIRFFTKRVCLFSGVAGESLFCVSRMAISFGLLDDGSDGGGRA
jgi:hypothetical protein